MSRWEWIWQWDGVQRPHDALADKSFEYQRQRESEIAEDPWLAPDTTRLLIHVVDLGCAVGVVVVAAAISMVVVAVPIAALMIVASITSPTPIQRVACPRDRKSTRLNSSHRL